MGHDTGSTAPGGSPAEPGHGARSHASPAAPPAMDGTSDREPTGARADRSRIAREPDSESRNETRQGTRSFDRERRERLVRRHAAVRARSTELAARLSPEDCQPQSMPEASPVKWHLAHTTWFFDTFVLGPAGAAVAPRWSEIFNSYYVTVGPRHARPARGLLTRPTLGEVLAYRAEVDERVARRITDSGADADALERIELGLNHEQQHQELLLMDVLHLLSANPLRPAYREEFAAERCDHERAATRDLVLPHRAIEVEPGVHAIGRDVDDARFAYDNETPAHRVFCERFALATRPSSCAEYLAFVEDDGYRRPELWMSDGWDAVEGEGWEAPLYWSRAGDGSWHRFGLTGERPLVPNEPVQHLSWYEADAFARWSGARLPREHEWEIAIARGFGSWTAEAECDARDTAIAESTGRDVRTGPRAMTNAHVAPGDGWEWTSSDYGAYPGFRPNPGALGEYNGKFMSGQLVLRGGSFATPPGHVRPTYRNYFWHTARWPFTQVRLAWDR